MTVENRLQPDPSVPTIEVYWMPGCSSCLRMKEFIESTGLPFQEINLSDQPEGRDKLAQHGLYVPATCVGDRCVNGVDLKAVADLIGADYEAPVLLGPAILVAKYDAVIAALCRLVVQIPPVALQRTTPDRDRSLLGLANHAGSVIRTFITAYDTDVYDISFYGDPPEDVRTAADVRDRAQETLTLFHDWWERAGRDDPLDRVVKTYWGHRTLHETLTREVWHSAQHTRQVAYFVSELGIEPDHPLTALELEGLPLPERVYD